MTKPGDAAADLGSDAADELTRLVRRRSHVPPADLGEDTAIVHRRSTHTEDAADEVLDEQTRLGRSRAHVSNAEVDEATELVRRHRPAEPEVPSEKTQLARRYLPVEAASQPEGNDHTELARRNRQGAPGEAADGETRLRRRLRWRHEGAPDPGASTAAGHAVPAEPGHAVSTLDPVRPPADASPPPTLITALPAALTPPAGPSAPARSAETVVRRSAGQDRRLAATVIAAAVAVPVLAAVGLVILVLL